jgi:copper chaperone NosL
MRRTNLWLPLAFMLIFSAVTVGCGKKTYEPAAIREETDKCETCSMQVTDRPYSTQIIMTDGRVYKFDDLGCMYEWKRENGTEGIGAEFVRDYHDNEWIKSGEAFYVYDPSFETPMSYGIYSFKNRAEAEAFAQEQGKGTLLTAADLDSHHWERHGEMPQDHGDAHDGTEAHKHGGAHDGTESSEHGGAHDGTETLEHGDAHDGSKDS